MIKPQEEIPRQENLIFHYRISAGPIEFIGKFRFPVLDDSDSLPNWKEWAKDAILEWLMDAEVEVLDVEVEG